jgi:hypothetical protein
MAEFKTISEKEFDDYLKKIELELKFYAPTYTINSYNMKNQLLYSVIRNNFSNTDPLQAHVSIHKHIFAYKEMLGDKKCYMSTISPVEIRNV